MPDCPHSRRQLKTRRGLLHQPPLRRDVKKEREPCQHKAATDDPEVTFTSVALQE